MEVQIVISEGFESQLVNEGQTLNKVVSPTLVLGARVIPTALSFSLSVFVANFEDITSFELGLKVINLKTDDVVFELPNTDVQLDPKMNSVNMNADLRNVFIANAGAFKAVATIDGMEYSQKFFVVETDVSK
ncbi:hypothetical protein EQG49_11645 [Periweissella cryptocerci]|uniref:Uncharacterized protein n=1 Tax=Periweissella cryptocerci TaxID=2506420 RepID=A0A4P6YW76_9LACO|nr:hypothetical protein [Periweissella cryptocerci]QBO37060.1 hypothetical protein EQG49_11645 [Periweissella cryptocerci]